MFRKGAPIAPGRTDHPVDEMPRGPVATGRPVPRPVMPSGRPRGDGVPTRLPAFNKPAGPDPKMAQSVEMLKKVMADRRRQQMKSGPARGVPKLPVSKALGI